MLRSIAVSLVLLSCSPSVWAGEGGAGAPADAPKPAETPAAEPTPPPSDGGTVSGVTQAPEGVAEDPDAEALDPEAAKALEALQGEVAAPDVPPPMNLDWMYQDGATAGAEDAKIAAGYGVHALAGLARAGLWPPAASAPQRWSSSSRQGCPPGCGKATTPPTSVATSTATAAPPASAALCTPPSAPRSAPPPWPRASRFRSTGICSKPAPAKDPRRCVWFAQTPFGGC
ncbi:MAG: hypothetical protein IPN01_03430 [Deltaproteobacteria bacterium]|nr:hypothetical protein [Deltaproteobacteria bacterium]